MNNQFDLLGVKQNASKYEIDRAYNKLMKKLDYEENVNKKKREDINTTYNMINKNQVEQLSTKTAEQMTHDPFLLSKTDNSLFDFLHTRFNDMEQFFNTRLANMNDQNFQSSYYSKEMISSMDGNQLYTKVRENNNGKINEFEEYKPINTKQIKQKY